MMKDDEMENLDSMLRQLPTPAPASEAFINRILAEAKPRPAHTPTGGERVPFRWRDMIAPLGGLALACTLGIMIGLSSYGRGTNEMLYMNAGDYIAGNNPLVEDMESLK